MSEPQQEDNEQFRFVNNIVLPDFDSLSFSDFDVIRQLGKGDVGVVQLVHLRSYPPNEQLYALKVLDNQDMIDRNKTQRCLTERTILEVTAHPFVVTMYTTFITEAKTYLLLEYCPGGEFFRVLKRQPGRCISESTARFYVAEVLHVLGYLHTIGVVYRDLKPENILIHQSGHIRLTDFDLAKQLAEKNLDEEKRTGNKILRFFRKDKEEEKKYKQMNSFVGTAEYLAPEIISGEGYSPLVDWWALGILLYEMLFEKTPFEGSDMNETFEKIVHFNKKELKIPESNQHGPISKHCRDLIASLLTKDPHARLGHKRGADEIKAHAFFHGVDFNSLSTMQPPIIPQIDSVLDFRNFQQFDKNVDVKKALEESSKKVNDEKSEDLIFELDS